mgnify:CR=1 FL=1
MLVPVLPSYQPELRSDRFYAELEDKDTIHYVLCFALAFLTMYGVRCRCKGLFVLSLSNEGGGDGQLDG